MKKKTISKWGQRAVAILCALTAIPFVGCDGGETSQDGDETLKETVVWAAYGTEKLLRETNYSTRHNEKTLKIATFQNEYESAQIMITAANDTKYTVQLADLTNENGTTLSKDAFSAYHEKYIYVDRIFDTGTPTSVGWYPDALLPYDTAVSYGENSIEKGDNQGVWVTLNTPKTQEEGVYTGAFKVTADGKSFDIPVEVTVYGYALSDETHIKTSFGINYDWVSYAELDSTPEMMQTYYDFLLDYRISPSDFPMALNNSYTAYKQEGTNTFRTEEFIEDAVATARNEKVASWRLPTIGSTATVTYTDNAGNPATASIPCVGKETYQRFLKDVATRALTEDLDLFEKAYTYMTFCDEYDASGAASGRIRVEYNYNKIKEYNAEIAEWIETLAKPETMTDERFSELKGEMKSSLLTMEHILTGASLDGIYQGGGLGLDTPSVTFVPTIDQYATEGNREAFEQYATEYGVGQTWAYTAVNPCAPYPTYHLEDQLISSRLLNWMLYDYDIEGNLFWSSTLYKYTGTSVQVQDYYSEPLRYSTMNGDGFLLYPGREYGIFGPVSCLRLESIRDGNEDYDLLYELEEFYTQRGVSGAKFDQLLNFMTNALYTNARCNYTAGDINAKLIASREMLADFLLLASKAGVVIESFTRNLNEVNFVISADEGVTLALGGKTLSGTTENGVTKYAVDIDLREQTVFALKATVNGEEYGVELPLGEPANIVESDALIGKISAYRSDVVLEETTDTIDGESVVKVSMTDEIGGKPSMQIDVEALAIDQKYKTVKVRIYNYGDEVTLSVTAERKIIKGYLQVGQITLAAGWNEVELDIASLNCAERGQVMDIRFNFKSPSEETLTDTVAIAIGEMIMEG
ncbi:MAG: DUF4091 domain-containing protein [Clostridia bacterium]|nr:DUF4091 domain-containing protein [Clostridia bacterium]